MPSMSQKHRCMTDNSNHFDIENTSAVVLVLYVEPEGQDFRLAPGEKVCVYGHDVTVRFSLGNDGTTTLSLWTRYGDFRVEKGGVNLLDTV